MRAVIKKGVAVGRVTAPPSKSMAHRILIAAALAPGESIIDNISDCEDVLASRDCLVALGASIEIDGTSARVRGIDPRTAEPSGELFARESGSTARFIIPIAWLSGRDVTIRGSEKLLSRPMSVYEKLAEEKGLGFRNTGTGIELSGRFIPSDLTVRGDVSSQFISGILFTLPFAECDVTLSITGKIESRSYIDMTLIAMRSFGVFAEWIAEDKILVKSGGYLPREERVEGDYSASAFTEALNLIGGEVEQLGLSEESAQGDRVYRDIFPKLNKNPTVSVADCPDLAPILMAMAAELGGAVFTDTARLKIKESDRAEAMREELSKLGARITVEDNRVTVHPSVLHTPSEPISSHNDHRIVMSLAVLLTRYGGVIEGAQAVRKSYPTFFEDLSSLGIEVGISE